MVDVLLDCAGGRKGGYRLSAVVGDLVHLSGWIDYLVIAALVFGETAVFLGFVLPGETAVVLGGVLASRGHVSLALLFAVVVVTAVTGPLVGYEIGRRMGDRLFSARVMQRVPGGPERARAALRSRGALAVLLGRFVAVVRAVMPAAAGAVRVPYRTFLVYNIIGGVAWGAGYCVLGYLAGSAYAAIERRVGTGLAAAVAAVVVVAAATWALRRHRAGTRPSRAAQLPAGSAGVASAGAASAGAGEGVAGSAGVASAGVASAGVASAGVASAGVASAGAGEGVAGSAGAGEGVAGSAGAGEGVAGADTGEAADAVSGETARD
jgi:membrane-associated protein